VHQQEEIIKVRKGMHMAVPLYTDHLLVQFYKVPPEELNISSLENSVVTRLVIKDST
jgi:mannose-6-phosphate isomerase-like protein (cupin superfamily)